MAPRKSDLNTLYYGDNLPVLRKYFADEVIDFIYLDPPFNSKADYNILFKEATGEESTAQIRAFTDFWHWNPDVEKTYLEIQEDPKYTSMLQFLHAFLGRNDMMAYLVMMTIRLRELYRVLKPTGSLFIHCDSKASHYLKIILDLVFGFRNFRNEVIWRRTGSHNKIDRYAPIHDSILFYSKTDNYVWKYPKRPYMKGHIEEYFIKDKKGYRTNYYGNVLSGSGLRGGSSGKPWRGFDPTAKGRHWAIPKAVIDEIDEDLSGLNTQQKLDRLYELGYIKIYPDQAWPIYERYLKEDDGQPLADIWAFQPYTSGTVFGTEKGIDEDIRWLSPRDRERLGYPTQKPVGLMERILKSCTDEEDSVLDPFCGCGTTIIAANNLKRKWIGIDITHLAISLIRSRLREIDAIAGKDYAVVGEPADFESAVQLMRDDPSGYQFQWWALSLVEARPAKSPNDDKKGKKGADKGIDGWLTFKESDNVNLQRIVVQVKGGANIGAQLVRDLIGTVQAAKSAMGIMITLYDPTKPMIDAALEAEYYQSPTWGHKYPKIQIITIPELLSGKRPNTPHTNTQRTMPNGLTKWVK